MTKRMMILAVACLMFVGCSHEAADRETFGAWCRVHQRNDVTFEDWRRLKSRNMLPGQDTAALNAAKNAENAAAFAVGFSAASAAGK